MSNEQLLIYEQEGPDQADNSPPVVLSATACEDDGAAAAILTTGGPAGRTTERDTIIVSTPPVVEKGKRKYRISPHPLKGTKQLFDNNVKNHYTEILK